MLTCPHMCGKGSREGAHFCQFFLTCYVLTTNKTEHVGKWPSRVTGRKSLSFQYSYKKSSLPWMGGCEGGWRSKSLAGLQGQMFCSAKCHDRKTSIEAYRACQTRALQLPHWRCLPFLPYLSFCSPGLSLPIALLFEPFVPLCSAHNLKLACVQDASP